MDDILKIIRMVRDIRRGGHFIATLDPLSSHKQVLDTARRNRMPHDSRRLPQKSEDVFKVAKYFGLDHLPLDKPFYLGGEVRKKGKVDWTITELIEFMKDCYCGNVGIEIQHIENAAERNWLQERVEGKFGYNNWNLSDATEQRYNFTKLLECDHTSLFLGEKFHFTKIFELEGAESLLPGLWSVLHEGSELGVDAVEMGMAHRGRINVLHNLFGKPFQSICNQFNESESTSGDIKFHLGARAEIDIPDIRNSGQGKKMHASLCANPSHLEAVYPVVIGKSKAKQFYINDTNMDKVLPLVLHGDAAFCGQGIVPETMELSNLPDYSVGGAVHIIINNQIGFTTDPKLARSSYHCSNIAKVIEVPVFHVNGDDVDAVVAVCRLAVQYRQHFHKDCVVDLVCYRRNGHTNMEDPKITQPLTYKVIETHPSTLKQYGEKLMSAGVITKEEIDAQSASLLSSFQEDFLLAKEYVADPTEWLSSNWQLEALRSLNERPFNNTGVKLETLRSVGQSLCELPESIKPHPYVEKLLESRKEMLKTGKGITLAFAEALAFGALLTRYTPDHHPGRMGIEPSQRSLDDDQDSESHHQHIPLSHPFEEKFERIMHPTVHVRLSGQDCVRGTFNQRHATIFCQETSRGFTQLNHIKLVDGQASLSVCNSTLSEAAVLAFEYGYSLGNELVLTIWEAQFGDFANVAQSIIDNFIVSGESKWNVASSLVMLLPHGYDGQGPEHSSARIERFLQMVDDPEDSMPGYSQESINEMEAGFDMLLLLCQQEHGVDPNGKGDGVNTTNCDEIRLIDGEPAIKTSALLGAYGKDFGSSREDMIERMQFMADYNADEYITKSEWVSFMSSWLSSHAERKYNLSVITPTTPSQYFHGLRRQIHRPFCKPVAIFTSKWLLHHKPCVSSLDDLGYDTFFRRIIVERLPGDNLKERTEKKLPNLKRPAEIDRLIICCGKIFYHMYHRRTALHLNSVSFIRLEQIAPFPFELMAHAIRRYPNAEIVWVQEEPQNMGAWSYVKPRIDAVIREKKLPHSPIRYVGRPPSAATATGLYRVHVSEQNDLIDEALL